MLVVDTVLVKLKARSYKQVVELVAQVEGNRGVFY